MGADGWWSRGIVASAPRASAATRLPPRDPLTAVTFPNLEQPGVAVSQAAAPTGRSTSRSTTSSASTSSLRTVPDAFRAIVTQHPDRLALRGADRSVTYE